MTRSTTPARRRHRRLAVAAAVLAATLGACTSADLGDVAATVDGEEITVEELEPRAEQIAAQTGEGETAAFRDALAGAVQDAALGAFLDDIGITASDDEIRETLEFAAQQSGLEYDDFLAQQAEAGLDEQAVLDAARFQVRIEKYQEDVFGRIEVSDDELEALFAERQAELSEADVVHILVETEQDAEAALARLDEGEAFADVAEDVSQDPGSAANGGSLGRAQLTTYVPEFAAAAAEAPIGEVVGPVQTQFGFHLIRVDDRVPPTYDDVVEQLREELAGQRFQPTLLEEVRAGLADVDIDVNSRFGRWDPAEGQIGQVVPAGPLEGRG